MAIPLRKPLFCVFLSLSKNIFNFLKKMLAIPFDL